MSVAQRKTPDTTNGGNRAGGPLIDAIDVEVEYLHRVSFGWLVSIGGTANAITAASDTTNDVVAITSYTRSKAFWFRPTSANTASATINIDGVGVATIHDLLGNVLAGGEFAIGGLYPLIYDGTYFVCPTVKAGAANTEQTAPDIILQDQKTSGTAAGIFTSGAYRTRTLNMAVRNVISGASLGSNQITLPAGTYYCEWRAPGFACNSHQTRLFNATDSSVLAEGSTGFSFTSTQTDSVGQCVFTITSSKAIELDHICQTTVATNGMGTPGSFSNIEVYAELRIWKQ